MSSGLRSTSSFLCSLRNWGRGCVTVRPVAQTRDWGILKSSLLPPFVTCHFLCPHHTRLILTKLLVSAGSAAAPPSFLEMLVLPGSQDPTLGHLFLHLTGCSLFFVQHLNAGSPRAFVPLLPTLTPEGTSSSAMALKPFNSQIISVDLSSECQTHQLPT